MSTKYTLFHPFNPQKIKGYCQFARKPQDIKEKPKLKTNKKVLKKPPNPPKTS